ncbi:hypothetical protein BD289DRAFT_139977 [Coniella lustricola]|uniref:Uncharacterized protein n=1 Tax=Coniella lustricola TaxID=2025994 RepID=A0A2T3AF79_9PEZI|nr:hypothetical protein BD289DRAFT_139977 [Coniella lustricola]
MHRRRLKIKRKAVLLLLYPAAWVSAYYIPFLCVSFPPRFNQNKAREGEKRSMFQYFRLALSFSSHWYTISHNCKGKEE